jgi:recombination protein RecA
MMYSHGISREGDLLDMGLANKFVEKSGSWLNYGDLRLGQGRENAKQFLRDNQDMAEELTRKILAHHNSFHGGAHSNGEPDLGGDD